MKFQEIVEKLGSVVSEHSLNTHKDNNPDIIGVAAVSEAKEQQLSYIEGPKFAAMVSTTAASALILPRDEGLQQEATKKGLAWLATPEPRLTFAHAIKLFYQPFQPTPGIHETAVIDPSVTLGKDVYIGPHVIIQQGVKIGDNACIQGNVVIYPEVTIGDRT